MGRAAARLSADRGAAARSDDLFRSRAFLDAEGVTHTLIVESEERSAAVPLIVREIGDSQRLDAVSPYGYPGALVRGDGPVPDRRGIDWEPTGLVSIFGRERLVGAPWMAGPRERSRVLLHEPGRDRQIRPRLREQIRANERAGWTTEAIAGPESEAADRAAFASAYAETMRRAGAAERYMYAPAYFDAVLAFGRSWLVVARDAEGVGAAAIAGLSDSTLHYYLGGTAERAREASPFKNVVAAMLDLSDELETALNLGGGVTAGDGLERFKRGFANAELAFRTHELVCDRDEYARLSRGSPANGFFPAYRATSG